MRLAEKESCTHDSKTLVQAIFQDEMLDSIWFVCWQCDLCGGITREEVTLEQLEGANDLPWLDEDSYWARTSESLAADVEILALRFMFVAVQPSLRGNGNGHR